MRKLLWIIGLCLVCISCSKPTSITTNSQYDATAVLNGTAWFGSTFAQREYPVGGKPCTVNRFALGLYTDLPHAMSYGEPANGVTGCTENCIPTQQIGFHLVPLAVGKYKLSEIQTCLEESSQTAGEYNLLFGGDVIVDRYYTPGVSIQLGQKVVTIPGTDESWIEVTSYDIKTSRIEGTFELTLKNIKGEVVHFTKGIFNVKLTR